MWKKVLKIFLWSLFSLLLLCSTGVAVGVYWVLTPERITATLQKQMKSMLLCKSEIGSVEVKLFSGYKVLSVEIRDVILRNGIEESAKDTILSAKRGYLQVDWMQWWKYNQLDIEKLILEKPHLYYFVNSKGKSNWDIFPPDTSKGSTASAMPFKEAKLPQLEVIQSDLRYQDNSAKIDAHLHALDFKLAADFVKSKLEVRLTCNTPRMLVKMGDELWWKDDPLEVDTKFSYWTDKYNVHLESMLLNSGDIQVLIKGDVQGDSLFEHWKMKLQARMDIPQIDKVIERIPESLKQPLSGIQVSGRGSIEGSVIGVYDSTQLPGIDFAINAPQIQVNMSDFADMPIALSDAKMRIHGDLDRIDQLRMELHSITARLLNSEFTGEGEFSELTAQMHFKGKIQGQVNLETISGHFLDTMGYHAQGNVHFDSQVDLSMDALLKQDWKRINVKADAQYIDLYAQSTADTLAFRSSSGHIAMQLHPHTQDGRNWFMDMKGFVNAASVEMKAKEMARFEHLKMDTRTSNFMDTTKSLEAAIVLNLKDILVPQNALQVAAPPQPLRIPECSLDLLWTPELSELHQAHIQMLGSDMTLTGQLKHFSQYLLGKEKLWGRLNVQSNQLDLGSMMALGSAWGVVESSTQQSQVKDDLSPQKDSSIVTTGPLMLPKDMDLEMHLNVKSALYGISRWGKILGAVTLKEGKLLLDKLKIDMPAGQVQLTALYRTPRKNHLFAGFDFHMVQVEMDELIRMIPNVDSIMPMLRSFSGKAEFHMVGETYMDSLYNLKKSTLRGAASIMGQNLILKDGHEFTEIARTLKFSKKNRILVDSLSAELTLFKNEVDVFPFQISMQNYKAVISGRHNLDMSFNYHISVTDSPLPFRLGVDVYGTMKDMHFRLAPVRYGYRYRPTQQRVVETQVLNLRKMIKASLEEGSNRE